jgi:3-deoxy-7-phosphoheptulonate synthase
MCCENFPLPKSCGNGVRGAPSHPSHSARAGDRLLVIMGPCSIHDVKPPKNTHAKLKEAKIDWHLIYCCVRVYFEKPCHDRMEGSINDPHLDGSFRINEGCVSRQLLLDLNEIGMPAGCGSST